MPPGLIYSNCSVTPFHGTESIRTPGLEDPGQFTEANGSVICVRHTVPLVAGETSAPTLAPRRFARRGGDGSHT